MPEDYAHRIAECKAIGFSLIDYYSHIRWGGCTAASRTSVHDHHHPCQKLAHLAHGVQRRRKYTSFRGSCKERNRPIRPKEQNDCTTPRAAPDGMRSASNLSSVECIWSWSCLGCLHGMGAIATITALSLWSSRVHALRFLPPYCIQAAPPPPWKYQLG